MRRVILLLFVGSVALAQQVGIEGNWLGTLTAGPMALRLVLKVSKDANGVLSAKLDSIDQGANDLPVSSISLNGGTVKFEMAAIRASFEGAWKGDAIEGAWTQGRSMPLVLKRTGKPPVIDRPQNPKKPYPYDEEEVSYPNKVVEGVTLAGTLTIPRVAGRHPAVLLLTGSGPQDRDESLMGHKPFLVMADHLTRKGIAVLRFDDRGFGKSTGKFATAAMDDFISDARAGIEFLKAHARIDARQLGIIGHSEGGLVAPKVAAGSADIAFIILMAGTGVIGEELLYKQGELIARAMGASAEVIAKQRAQQTEIFAVVKSEAEEATRAAKVRAFMDKSSVPGGDAQVRMMSSAWFRELLTYDPAPTLAKVKQPVLAINGELDLQVPPSQNLPPIVKALEVGGNQDYAAVKLRGLNHLFQTSKTGAVSEYAQIEETIAPVALETISDWILRHVTRI